MMMDASTGDNNDNNNNKYKSCFLVCGPLSVWGCFTRAPSRAGPLFACLRNQALLTIYDIAISSNTDYEVC